MDAANERLQRGKPDDSADELVDAVVVAWRRLIHELCETWWPPNLYPNWSYWWLHPSQRFVGACLLWDPKQFHAGAAREWTRLVSLGPKVVRYDPTRLDEAPEMVLWRSMWNGLMERLTAAFQDGPTLNEEQISQAVDDAVMQGLKERPDGPRYAFVPIFPGMSSSDWRAIETNMLEFAADRLPEHACKLEAQGMSRSQIAGELGLDRRSIQRYLSHL